jgi:hypothetical protein
MRLRSAVLAAPVKPTIPHIRAGLSHMRYPCLRQPATRAAIFAGAIKTHALPC